MGDKRRPADELENAPTRSLPKGADAVPPLLRELARTPEVFAGSLAPGSRLGGGRYIIERLVGKGGMGAVYLANDEVLAKEVALKLVDERFAGDLERLRDEVLLAQEVSHRNVCRTYDLEEVEGHWLVKMEYIDGQTLADKVTAAGRLSVAEACAIARQIAQGLAAAHERGVVHRDLKPQNILVEKDSKRVVLMDFGLARLAELAGQTAEGVAGTPEYMAPEQARGREVDGRADLYALGCVLYQMLTGQVVFPAETAMAAALRHVEDPPPDPRAARPDIPAWLAQLILRLLEKDPARRPADAAEVSAALSGPPPRWLGRRRRVIAAAAVVAAMAAVGGSLALRHRSAPPQPRWAPVLLAHEHLGHPSVAGTISRDGTTLVFMSSTGEIWTERRGGGARRTFPLPEGTEPLGAWLEAIGQLVASDHGERAFLQLPRSGRDEIWEIDLGTGRAMQRWPTTQSDPPAVAFDVAPDGATLLVGTQAGDDARWWLWRLGASGHHRPLGDPVETLWDARWSPDGRRVARVVGPLSLGWVEILDADSGRLLETLQRFCFKVDWLTSESLACFGRGVSSSLKNPTRPFVYEMRLGSPADARVLYVGAQVPVHLRATRAGVFFASYSQEQHLRVLDIGSRTLQPIPSGTLADTHAGWTSDGTMVFAGQIGGRFSLVALGLDGRAETIQETGIAEIPLCVLGDVIIYARFFEGELFYPFGRIADRDVTLFRRTLASAPVALGTSKGFVDVLCAGDRAPPCYLAEQDGANVRLLEWSPDTGTRGREVLRWSGPTHLGEGALSPDGRIVARALYDVDRPRERGEIVLLPIAGGNPTELHCPECGAAEYLTWDPDGHIVASERAPGRFRVVRVLADGNIEVLADSKTLWFMEPRVSPDGKTIAVLATDMSKSYWWVPAGDTQ